MNELTTFQEFLIALGYCLFMLVLGFILLKFPPKKINSLYGYRTSRSMKNQEVWDAANTYAGLSMVKMMLWSISFPVIAYLFYPTYILLITLIGNTILLVISAWRTEGFLRNNFDKDGFPLNK